MAGRRTGFRATRGRGRRREPQGVSVRPDAASVGVGRQFSVGGRTIAVEEVAVDGVTDPPTVTVTWEAVDGQRSLVGFALVAGGETVDENTRFLASDTTPLSFDSRQGQRPVVIEARANRESATVADITSQVDQEVDTGGEPAPAPAPEPGTGTVAPGDITLGCGDLPDAVGPGESVTFRGTVTNSADFPGSVEVEWTVGGTAVVSERVEVAPGETVDVDSDPVPYDSIRRVADVGEQGVRFRVNDALATEVVP